MLPSHTLDTSMVLTIQNSWLVIQSIDGYERKLGKSIYQRLLNEDPENSLFDILKQVGGNEWMEHPNSTRHALVVVDMLDCIVCGLQADGEFMSEQLAKLGFRHQSYGVKRSEIPAMGDAFLYAVKETLGGRFSDHEHRAWATLMKYTTEKMMKGMV